MNISKENKINAIKKYINDLVILKYVLLDECEEIKVQYQKYKENMLKVDYINNTINKLEQELDYL